MNRLGSRLVASFWLASLGGGVAGWAATFLVPPRAYEGLMLTIMNPPPGTTAATMDAMLDAAITRIVAWHVAVAMLGAMLVAGVMAPVIVRHLEEALAPVVAYTARMAAGELPEGLPIGRIRELDQLVAAVNRLGEALRASERQRRLALARIGHELATPVMTLRGYLDGVQQGVMAPAAPLWEGMARSLRRLEAMAGELSALGRAEAAATAVRLEAVAVMDLMEPVLQDVSRAMDVPPPPLVVGEGAAGAWVRADPDRFGEVLENLLRNAYTYTPKGGQVTVRIASDGKQVTISVEDTGVGIDPEDLPWVMEPFYRGREGAGSEAPGMGVGLTIARQWVEAMGGTLAIASPGRGRGTVAQVQLQRVAPPAADQTLSQP